MIEVRDLRFAYGEGGFELQVEWLSIATGERVCLVGPSGSGKTTLLQLVAGIVSPAAGHLETCGQVLTELRDAARRDFRIANVGLVLGVTLLFSRITLGRDTTWIDLPLLMVVVLVTWFLLYDLELSRSNSLVLLGMLALFFFRVAQHARQSNDDIEAREIPTLTLPLAWLSFLGGLVLLIASSRILVWAASLIAAELGVSELVIGLTIVAVGTSLPELAASVMSALKGHADMAVGAIVGSDRVLRWSP